MTRPEGAEAAAPSTPKRGPFPLPTVLSRIEAAFLAASLLGSALLLFVNVVLRYVFSRPLFWAEEAAGLAMAWMIFVGAGRVAGTSGHVAVEVFTDLLPERLGRAYQRCLNAPLAAFCLVLAYYGLRHALRVLASGQATPALGLPMGLAYLAVSVGAASMGLRYAILLFTGSRAVPEAPADDS